MAGIGPSSSVFRIAVLLLGLVPGWLAAAGDRAATDADPPESGRASAREPDERRLPAGISIERVPETAEDVARRRRLLRWRPLYRERLARLRSAHAALALALESSSLAGSRGHCRVILEETLAVDRRSLFRTSEAGLGRLLYGALERYRAGAELCLEGRYLRAHRLLSEARSGLVAIDRRLDRELREPIRLEGLER